MPDVVIVGGGVNGASTAFHLARAGVRSVTLLERRQLGAGASGKSGAVVRMHYTNPQESRLAYESLMVFQNWSDAVGGDCGFEPCGFVEMVAPEQEPQLRKNVADQQAIGIRTSIISAQELKELVPELNVDGLTVAAYEPDSGFADPNATLFGFIAAAQRLGVEVRTGVDVTRVLTSGGRATGVETPQGRIEADAVVLVPGVWAKPLLQPLGLDFGLHPHRVQVAVFRWPMGFTRRHPAMIDTMQHFWLRPEGAAGTLIGLESGVEGTDIDRLDEGVDEAYVLQCREKLASRLPDFANATMRGGWAGLITLTPDERPIIDQIPSVPGLFCMLGDSGTSFKTSPAIGRVLAEWITQGKPQLMDMTPFRCTRFAEGKPWHDDTSYGWRHLTVSR